MEVCSSITCFCAWRCLGVNKIAGNWVHTSWISGAFEIIRAVPSETIIQDGNMLTGDVLGPNFPYYFLISTSLQVFTQYLTKISTGVLQELHGPHLYLNVLQLHYWYGSWQGNRLNHPRMRVICCKPFLLKLDGMGCPHWKHLDRF